MFSFQLYHGWGGNDERKLTGKSLEESEMLIMENKREEKESKSCLDGKRVMTGPDEGMLERPEDGYGMLVDSRKEGLMFKIKKWVANRRSYSNFRSEFPRFVNNHSDAAMRTLG